MSSPGHTSRLNMASINRLMPSIANGSLEIAPALANINFDFALWKVAAPKEFEGVGSALSSFRREEAEGGMLHTVARKLGALFERKIPTTPGLTKAYGTRASEIAQALSLNERDRKSYGVFANRAGADATSLWAAATSGTSAISVHLLACLLARIWDAPEAISIWVEIVKKRKDEVVAQFDETDIAHLATLSAARQDFPRAQIAKWDASARAWLRVADKVKIKQQKQLTLILDNIQVPVNGRTDTYMSVMEAWHNSLTQMEALLQGISQQARNGDILLALYSWHLFPDITVVKPSMAHVRQNDPVFASGGVLTLGLETSTRKDTGVHWSLPLAYLRHYGAPVVSACSMSSDLRSRLSLPELLQATLGCLLRGWGAAGKDTLRSLTWLSSMYSLLHEATKQGSGKAALITKGIAQYSWLALLSNAASVYIASSSVERQHYNKLISLGRKHGKTFLGSPAEPLFGLINQGRFVSLIAKEEDKILLLRRHGEAVAKQMYIDGSQILIRYKHHLPGSRFVFEYATAMPLDVSTKTRKAEQSEERNLRSHHRWLYAGRRRASIREWSHNKYVERCSPEMQLQARDKGQAIYARAGDHSRRSDNVEEDLVTMAEDYQRRSAVLYATGESVSKREDCYIKDLEPGATGILWADPITPLSDLNVWFKFVYGDVHDAALFVVERFQRLVDTVQTHEANADEMYSLFENKAIDRMLLAHELEFSLRYARADVDPHLKSLKAISTAANMFQHFPYASVDVRVLQRELYDASWVRTCIGTQKVRGPLQDLRGTPESLEPYALSKAQAFACITMLESGQFDVDPNHLRDVMAMSSGDVIYVSAALLADPYDEVQPGDIQGVVGNIGRPGISFLVPPKDPMIKEVSLAEWPLIERSEFDGHLSDHFGSTSLHLSFTSAETPLNLGFSGGQDTEACILETLFSVYEGGRWIADLNIFKWANSIKLSKLPSCTTQHLDTDAGRSKVICIDSWLGLVDAPEEHISLVRAHGNWQARLAASSISLALGYNTIILPEQEPSYINVHSSYLLIPPVYTIYLCVITSHLRTHLNQQVKRSIWPSSSFLTMHTPFERLPEPNYGAVAPCTRFMIKQFNDAARLATGQAGNCSICHDTLGGDGVSAKLVVTVLPRCKHRFHEVCIMQWLTPIQLPSTDQAPATGTTATSGSVHLALSEAPRTSDDDNNLPQQIASLATQNFIHEAAGMMQSIMDGLDDNISPARHAFPRARELVGMLASRDQEQIRIAVREINERRSQILTNSMLEFDNIFGDYLEDRLEEGEIREEDQSLPSFDLFDDSSFDLEPIPRSSRTERRGNCPLCRGCAFDFESPCHVDSLQLLRVRLRLNDLAYVFFRYEHTTWEKSNRIDTAKFLERRYNDSVTLGEPEKLPGSSECRKLFKEARHALRVSAYRYMQVHRLSATEQLRVVQLVTFYENFELRDDMITYFFDPKPQYHGKGWKVWFPSRELQSFSNDPKGLLSRVRLEPVSEGTDRKRPIEVVADEEMIDGPPSSRLRKSKTQEYQERRARLSLSQNVALVGI
ncbi:MAG: hypothetical protein Q9216_001340 [Gyalolechia sp. 2 TL-2023]